MANQGRDEFNGQGQLRKNDNMNLGYNNPGQNQNTSFVRQAGEGMKHVVQGVATVAQGAVQGATHIAQGAADGAANIAHGAASAVRNNLGSNTDNSDTLPTTNRPNYPKM